MSDTESSNESEVTESDTVVKSDGGERYRSLQANNSGEEQTDG